MLVLVGGDTLTKAVQALSHEGRKAVTSPGTGDEPPPHD
jgi:hypothetical protein